VGCNQYGKDKGKELHVFDVFDVFVFVVVVVML
jgi:hypothetical protein